MLRHAHEVPDGSTLTADVCIVGAGPVGLTLARELARGRRLRVCILESGGEALEPGSQALAEGETTGDPFKCLDSTRRRQFGGTSNLWDTRLTDGKAGFRGAPLDAIDFERRDWVPHSGWPFDRAHMDPFYARANAACGFGPYEYAAEAWERPGAARLPVSESVMSTGILQFGSQRLFTHTYREDIARSKRIDVYLRAIVVEIEATGADGDGARAVTRLRVARLEGGSGFSVAAHYVVLAAGGIENARLLLLSDRAQRGGLGNGHDLVGRHFMEHQYVHTGKLVVDDRALFDRAAIYDERVVDGTVVMGNLTLSDAALRRERLLQASLALVPQHLKYCRFRQEAVDSLATIIRSARHGRLPERAGEHVREIVTHLDYVAVAALRKASGRRLFRYRVQPSNLLACGWSELDDKPNRFGAFDVILHAEQAPDPDNRVTLCGERDALGLRKPRLHWQWRERDVDSVMRAQELMGAELRRAGIGRLEIDLVDGRPNLLLSGLHHHLGTTRMHDDPRHGVVNANGRVHGTANLYATGCSVFPTGGYINPTLTAVALSIRLADHLGAHFATAEPGHVTAAAAVATNEAGN